MVINRKEEEKLKHEADNKIFVTLLGPVDKKDKVIEIIESSDKAEGLQIVLVDTVQCLNGKRCVFGGPPVALIVEQNMKLYSFCLFVIQKLVLKDGCPFTDGDHRIASVVDGADKLHCNQGMMNSDVRKDSGGNLLTILV